MQTSLKSCSALSSVFQGGLESCSSGSGQEPEQERYNGTQTSWIWFYCSTEERGHYHLQHLLRSSSYAARLVWRFLLNKFLLTFQILFSNAYGSESSFFVVWIYNVLFVLLTRYLRCSSFCFIVSLCKSLPACAYLLLGKKRLRLTNLGIELWLSPQEVLNTYFWMTQQMNEWIKSV